MEHELWHKPGMTDKEKAEIDHVAQVALDNPDLLPVEKMEDRTESEALIMHRLEAEKTEDILVQDLITRRSKATEILKMGVEYADKEQKLLEKINTAKINFQLARDKNQMKPSVEHTEKMRQLEAGVNYYKQELVDFYKTVISAEKLDELVANGHELSDQNKEIEMRYEKNRYRQN